MGSNMKEEASPPQVSVEKALEVEKKEEGGDKEEEDEDEKFVEWDPTARFGRVRAPCRRAGCPAFLSTRSRTHGRTIRVLVLLSWVSPTVCHLEESKICLLPCELRADDEGAGPRHVQDCVSDPSKS